MGALASVLSVRLCLVPFWTTQPSYRESYPTASKDVEDASWSPENCLADPKRTADPSLRITVVTYCFRMKACCKYIIASRQYGQVLVQKCGLLLMYRTHSNIDERAIVFLT